MVVKGGGGEAERAPGKRLAVHVHDLVSGQAALELAPLLAGSSPAEAPVEDAALVAAVWAGDAAPVWPVATIVGTVALALLALEPGLGPDDADRRARAIWIDRAR